MFEIIEGDVFIVDEDGNRAKLNSGGELGVFNRDFLDLFIKIHNELHLIRHHLEEITDSEIKMRDLHEHDDE